MRDFPDFLCRGGDITPLYYSNKGDLLADEGKCSHEGCGCGVTGDSNYCSDHCRDADGADMTEIACDCGHGGCS